MAKIMFISIFFILAYAHAEKTTLRHSSYKEQTRKNTETKIIGEAYIRPSYQSIDGELHTENEAEIGVKFPSGHALSYKQYFNTNLYNPSSTTESQFDLGFKPMDGYLRYKTAKYLFVPNTETEWAYEGRLILPTQEKLRNAGLISVVGNYFKIIQPLSRTVTLEFREGPWFHLYSQDSAIVKDKLIANPIFENRFVILSIWSLTQKLSFTTAFFTHIFKHRDVNPAAKNNNAWNYAIWINPELEYALSSNVSLGAGYYSDNLLSNQPTDLNLGQGFESGVTQIFLRLGL